MLKKIFTSLILGTVLMGTVLLLAVSAAEAPQLPDSCEVRADPARVGVTGCDVGTCIYGEGASDCGICCLLGTVLWITDWIFVFLIILVLILVLFGAFDILTAAGNTDKVTQGRNYIMFAAIGFAVALLSRAIPALVRYIVAPTAI